MKSNGPTTLVGPIYYVGGGTTDNVPQVVASCSKTTSVTRTRQKYTRRCYTPQIRGRGGFGDISGDIVSTTFSRDIIFCRRRRRRTRVAVTRSPPQRSSPPGPCRGMSSSSPRRPFGWARAADYFANKYAKRRRGQRIVQTYFYPAVCTPPPPFYMCIIMYVWVAYYNN